MAQTAIKEDSHEAEDLTGAMMQLNGRNWRRGKETTEGGR